MKTRVAALPVCAILLLASLPLAVSAQGKGRVFKGVLSDTTGRAVANATIDGGKSGILVSDDSGHFEFRLPDNKPWSFEIKRLGFIPTTLKLPAGADTSISLQLFPSVQSLAELKILASNNDKLAQTGFYDRMRSAKYGTGTGTFITPEQIDSRRPPRITQLLEGIPGVRVRQHLKLGGVPVGTVNGECLLGTIVNGVH